jgi:hypothetical protein
VSALPPITRCRDITDDHINAAIETREGTRELLEHAAGIAKPREAGARVLLVFSKMATSACDWVDGALRVELARNGEQTVIESFADIGAGLKERVFPRMVFNVPYEEFVAAIKKFPQAIVPLSVHAPSDDRMSLTAAEAEKLVAPDETSPRIPTPPTLSIADLPTVDAAATAMGVPAIPGIKVPKPLAKLKLRRSPALAGTISEEIVRKPVGDRRRDITGENPAMTLLEPPGQKEEKVEKTETKDDVDEGWE